MKVNTVLWGTVMTVVGASLLVQKVRTPGTPIWDVLWAALLLILGLLFLAGAILGRRSSKPDA